jgi:hypothetical protein
MADLNVPLIPSAARDLTLIPSVARDLLALIPSAARDRSGERDPVSDPSLRSG